MGVVPGWADGDVFVLLELFRAHLWDYIYRSSEAFAEIVHAALPAKSEQDVVEAVRLVMKQFALAFNTRNFRGQRIVVDGSEMFVYEYLHETIKLLRENRSGGVFLPDELVRFLRKSRMYKHYFHSKPYVFFSRIQLWGKSVAESQAKFYALRDMYHIEKQAGAPGGLSTVNAVRFQELAALFSDVPRVPPKVQATVPASKYGSKLWSPDDLEVLVDLLVTITQDMQQKGTSSLVGTVASKLGRTEGSCVNKLQDIRERFLKRSPTFRAANLPDIIYDTESDANKIFNADWTDPNDPYAIGYLAMKSHFNRTAKKKKTIPVTSFRATRSSINQTASVAGSNQQPNRSRRSEHQLSSSSRDTSITREVASTYGWTDEQANAVLAAMKRNLPLYRAKQRLAFYNAISKSMGAASMDDTFVFGSQILRLLEARFGGLQKFEAMPFGCEDANSADPALTVTRSNQENDSATTANSHFYKRNSANDRRTEDLDATTGLRSLDSDCIRPHSQHQATLSVTGKSDNMSLDLLDGVRSNSYANGFTQGSEIDWEDDSPERLSPGDEDGSEDPSESPEHTCQSLDSPEHTSSTSSCTSDSKESRRSDGNPRKRFGSLSHNTTSFCISCRKKFKGIAGNGKAAAHDSSFGKQLSAITKSIRDAPVGSCEDDGNEDDGADDDDHEQDDEDDSDSEALVVDDDGSDIGDGVPDNETKAGSKLSLTLQTLMRSVDARISELESRNRELIERKEERQRLAAQSQAADSACNEAAAHATVVQGV